MKVYLAIVDQVIHYSDEQRIAEGVFSTPEKAGEFLNAHGVTFQDNRWKGEGKLFGDLVEFEINVGRTLDSDG